MFKLPIISLNPWKTPINGINNAYRTEPTNATPGGSRTAQQQRPSLTTSATTEPAQDLPETNGLWLPCFALFSDFFNQPAVCVQKELLLSSSRFPLIAKNHYNTICTMSSISLPSLLTPSSDPEQVNTPSTPYEDPATEWRNEYDNIQRLLTEIRSQMTRIENIVVTIMSRLV